MSAMGGVMLGLLLCLAAVVEADDLQYTVHIAVLVPDDDIRPYTRKRMRPAIDLAVEKVGRNKIHPLLYCFTCPV